ncbi:MAG: SurA N-terminal domain-containing protein [Eubacteriaceae bacterium]
MKSMKMKALTGALVGIILVGFLGTGCSLVQVNPEKDKEQVVAEIDGTPVLKESFNNYMAYYQMYFDANGMTLPTGAKLTELKKDLLDDLVRVETMATQAKKQGITIDEAAATADSDGMISNLKTTLGESKYTAVLGENNSTPESFETFIKTFVVDNNYANKLLEEYNASVKADPTKVNETVVGKINGEDVKRDIYDYRLANEEFLTYYQTQKPLETDEETMKTTNKTIFDTIASQNAMVTYAKENNLTPSQEAIDSNIASQDAFINNLLPGDEALQRYLDQKYMTIAQFKEFEKEDGIAQASSAAIQENMKSKIEISDKEIKKYYDENKESYDTSTVSAKHILTEDKALADQIYAEAKAIKNTSEFDALMKKYSSETNTEIKEAADLGAFTYGTMVKPFSEAAFKMSPGEVSKPVKTDFGYHIIYVYDKNEVPLPTLEDKSVEISNTLKSEKAGDEYKKFTEDLLKKQKIEIGEIVSPIDAYIEQLKEELNVKVHENKI